MHEILPRQPFRCQLKADEHGFSIGAVACMVQFLEHVVQVRRLFH